MSDVVWCIVVVVMLQHSNHCDTVCCWHSHYWSRDTAVVTVTVSPVLTRSHLRHSSCSSLALASSDITNITQTYTGTGTSTDSQARCIKMYSVQKNQRIWFKQNKRSRITIQIHNKNDYHITIVSETTLPVGQWHPFC